MKEALQSLLNRVSAESNSNTPDFVLAEFMSACLDAYNAATNKRDAWYRLAPVPLRGVGVRPAEAIYAFIAWLSTQDTTAVIGARHDAGVWVQIMTHFIDAQGWQPVREDYMDGVVSATPELTSETLSLLAALQDKPNP